MNIQLYIHHLKRHFNSIFSYLIYALLILYFVFSGSKLSATELSSLTVDIAVVDHADNMISQQYIADLQQHDILKIQTSDMQTANALLEREVIDLIIDIPQDYDPSDLNKKLNYYFLSNNVIAPAALDLLAVDLVPHVVKQRLIDIVERYQVGDKTAASERFTKYHETQNANFDIEVLTPQLKSKLLGERTLITIENAKKTLSFAMFSILLIVVLPLSLRLKTSTELRRRMSLSEHGIIHYSGGERAVSLIYLLVLWSIAVISVTTALQLNQTLTLVLVVSGGILIMFYYELLRLLMTGDKQNYLTSLLALTVIILPAIIGGVFFASDLLPPAISAVAKFLPFNILENSFYHGLELGAISINDIFLIGLYAILGNLLLLSNLSLAKRRLTNK